MAQSQSFCLKYLLTESTDFSTTTPVATNTNQHLHEPMNFIFDYVFARANESSTWRGIIFIATAVGLHIDPSQSEAIVATGLSLAGLINVFRKETK
jgi:hypothetical protein